MLGHGVQGRTVLEPLNLALVEGVVKLDIERLAILGVDTESDGLTDSELSAHNVNLGIRGDAVIVSGVSEGERKHTLLLQVGLVDTGERAGDDSKTAQVTGLKGSVLSGGTLAVVPVTNDNPLNAASLVVASSSGDGIPLASDGVLDLVGLAVGSVGGTDQHVVGDVIQVTTVLQPWASHGDVISGGLALSLDEDGDASDILAIPSIEGREDLETVRGGGDIDLDGLTVLGGSLVCVSAGVIAERRKTVTSGGLELELLAVLALQGIGQGVEVKSASNGEGDDEIGGSDEGVSGRVAVVTTGEVTVVRRDDGVSLTLLDIATIPLANARTAGVSEDDTAELLEGLELAITLNGGANLLGTGGDGESRLGLEAVVKSVTGDGSSAGHVLIRGVGARTDQADLDLLRPAVLLGGLLKLGDRGSQVRGEGTVDVRLKLAEVELNELVVLSTLILPEVLGVGAGEVTDVLTASSLEVVVHAVVEGEERGGGTNLSTHVTDGTHTSAGEGVDTRAVVFNDSTSTTLDSEDIGNLQDDICSIG